MSKKNAIPLSSLEFALLRYKHSLDEIGAITVMMAHIWRHSERGVPDEEKGFCHLLGCTKSKFRKAYRPLLDAHFENKGGRWFMPIDHPLLVNEQRLSWPEWASIRTAVFERDAFTCQYCGQRGGKLECDHVVPISRGGSNDIKNLVTACRDCNRDKRDKTPQEWMPHAP